MDRWPEAADFIEQFCARHGIARTPMLRLTLLVEELFTNLAEHGSAGGTQAQVRLELGMAQDALELLLEDTAPPFDPLTHARERPPDFDGPVDERLPGGLGLHLVATLAHGARYAREHGCNRLWLRLALTPDAADRGGGSPSAGAPEARTAAPSRRR